MHQHTFQKRRKILLHKMEENSILILPSAPHQTRNRDVKYPYHQYSNFSYLSDFMEPDSVLVLKKLGKKKSWILFCRDKDPKQQQWDGSFLGTKEAVSVLGATEAWAIESWSEKLPEFLMGIETIYFNFGEDDFIERSLLQLLKKSRQHGLPNFIPPHTIRTPDPLLHEMRLIKSKKEIKLLKKATSITTAAHLRAMRFCRAGLSEKQLEGEIIQEFYHHNTRTVAYNPIVASGNNSCTLHYIKNNDILKDGNLVLIDAGAEFSGYAADLTRTFPVSGKFTDNQKQLYNIVNKHLKDEQYV